MGGVSFVAYSLYIAKVVHPLLFRTPPARHEGKKASNQGKKGQNLIFICSFLSYLGIFGDRNSQKPNIFLKSGCKVGTGCGSACLPFGVSAGVGV